MDFALQEDLKRIVNFFAKRKEVLALYFFGSVAKGYLRKESDIDIAVLISPEFLERIPEVKEEYYNATPSFSLRPVDVVILNTAPPLLRFEVFKHGKLLLDKDPEFRKNFLCKSLLEYYDYLYMEKLCFNYVKQRLKKDLESEIKPAHG